jgi:hypothetical protein
VLVLARSAVFLIWEHASFDSDQAIFGLMATHISEGRAFPLFMYGQQYMLAVQAWLAAPLFALFGPSLAVLKLPIVAVNVATASLLLWVLHRDARLPPPVALLVSMFYVLAPPGMAASLVETGGGNPEPFLYVLLLWILRQRPLSFGMVLGIGFLHREFTAYGAAAIVVLALLQEPRISADRLRAVALAAVGYLIVWELARIAFLYSTPNGPGSTFGHPLTSGAKVAGLLGRVCWDPAAIGPVMVRLFRDSLAMSFGVDTYTLEQYGIVSARRSGLEGLPTIWPLLQLTFLIALGRVVWLSLRERQPPWQGSAAPATFLLLVGVQAIVAYGLTRCGVFEVSTFRYLLLSLYAGVGVLALFFVYERRREWRWGIGAVVLTWCAVSVGAHLGLIREYTDHPPRNVRRELAASLADLGVRYARAEYWTAYHTTFLAEERVIVASTDFVRIDQYQKLVEAHGTEAVAVRIGACPGGAGREIVPGIYWICPE